MNKKIKIEIVISIISAISIIVGFLVWITNRKTNKIIQPLTTATPPFYPSLSSDVANLKIYTPDLNGDEYKDRLISYELPYFSPEYNEKDFYISAYLWNQEMNKYIKIKQRDDSSDLININNNIESPRPKDIVIEDFNNDNKDEIFISKPAKDIGEYNIAILLKYSEQSNKLYGMVCDKESIKDGDMENIYREASREKELTKEIKKIIMNQTDRISYDKADEISIKDESIFTNHYLHEEAELTPGILTLIPSGPIISTEWIVSEGRIIIKNRTLYFQEVGMSAPDEGE